MSGFDPTQGMSQQQEQPDHKTFLKGLLSNFLFSLGQGLTASSQAAPGQSGPAGLGGALQAPEILRQRRLAEQRQLEQMQTEQARQAQYEAQTRKSDELLDLQKQDLLARVTGKTQANELIDTGEKDQQGNPIQVPRSQIASIINTNKRSQVQIEGLQKRLEQQARSKRMKYDEGGNLVPIPSSEFTEEEKFQDSYKHAQMEHLKALTASANSKSNPDSAEHMMELLKLDQAERRLNILETMAKARMWNTEAGLFGTVEGEAIPYAPRDASGNLVGLKVLSQIPSNMRARAMQADIVLQMAGEFKRAIDSASDYIGPGKAVAGSLAEWTGVVPDQLQQYEAAKNSFTSLLPILHSYRGGIEAHQTFSEMFGRGLRTEPSAQKAAIDEMVKFASKIKEGAILPVYYPGKPGANVQKAIGGGGNVVQWERGPDGKPRPKQP